MTRTTCTIAALILVTACAQSPESIAPASMGDAYAGVSCARARAMLADHSATLADLSTLQRSAAASDTIGVILIGLPLASMTGGDKAGQIATEKGAVNALNAKLETCG